MSEIFAGVRVVEVAGWHMVPAAGAVLADFGADVVKVENPAGGDQQRQVPTPDVPESSSGVSLTMEQSNRGKRSLALDISRPDGMAVLHDLVRTADVFMTNFLPATRRKLGIEVEDVRALRSDIVYVRGDAVGRRGPEAGKPGFDYSVFWGRAGVAHAVAGPDASEPVTPRPGFGDRTSSMNIAFGVAGALFRRGRTGEGAVVDVSLLGSGMWSNSGDLMTTASVPGAAPTIERPTAAGSSSPCPTPRAGGESSAGSWGGRSSSKTHDSPPPRPSPPTARR